MTLRIGLDARTLLLARPTGVERVIWEFVESLTRVAPPDQHYELFVDEEPAGRGPAELPGELVVVPTRYPRLQSLADLWIAAQMRRATAERKLDAFLSFNTKFPFTPRPVFTTVHGLEWYFCAPDYRVREKLKQWVWFQLCSRFSRGLITFCQHTAQDIRRLRPGCELPTCVVPEGVGAAFRRLPPHELSAESRERLGVPGPYVLSVCSHEPRKNLDRLIRAFALALREHDLPHQLLLVGGSGWKSSRLTDLIAEQGLVGRVVLPGYISEEDLLQAYNQAELFVYPSKYEGFGLPLVEAMACGVPVVTSDSSSMAEVAGVAALLIDPTSDRELADAIALGLSDEPRREELVAAGLERVKRYSWDEMTRGICEFLGRELGRSGGLCAGGEARPA